MELEIFIVLLGLVVFLMYLTYRIGRGELSRVKAVLQDEKTYSKRLGGLLEQSIENTQKATKLNDDLLQKITNGDKHD